LACVSRRSLSNHADGKRGVLVSRTTLDTSRPEGRVRAAIRAWRDCGFLRKTAQMSLAWLGLAALSAGAAPWSDKDLAWLAVLLVASFWRL
jgi:hypothetical protein